MATAPFSYLVDAQFVEAGSRSPSVITVSLPLGCLPYLTATTLWKDGALAGFHSNESGEFHVDMESFDPKHHRARTPYDLLPPWIYPLHRMSGPSWCRVYPTRQGIELIVPNWEIIRNWYLFDSRIIPSVLAGAITRPDTVSARYVPWQPEDTRLLPPDGAQIVHADRLSRDVALCLARLILDPAGREGAEYLHQSIKGNSQRPLIQLPPVKPPFRCLSRWDVDYMPIPAHGSEPERLLVTCLRGTQESLPYKWIQVSSSTDFRQGPHSNSELPRVHRNTTRIILPEEDALDLYGDGHDGSLESAPAIGLFFGNSALNVEIKPPPDKTEQHYRGGHDNKSPVPIQGASVDDTALTQPGVAPLASSNVARADDHQRTRAHVLEIAPLFAEVMAEVAAHPEIGADWKGDFPFGTGTVRMHNSKRGTKRGFVVARLTNELRHIYLLDAETLTESESFRLILTERRHGGTLSEQHVQQWLGAFPHRPGCPWECETSLRLGLALERVKHQPHLLNQAPERTRAQFKSRLTEKVLSLILR